MRILPAHVTYIRQHRKMISSDYVVRSETFTTIFYCGKSGAFFLQFFKEENYDIECSAITYWFRSSY